jgi:hypothetical protein
MFSMSRVPIALAAALLVTVPCVPARADSSAALVEETMDPAQLAACKLANPDGWTCAGVAANVVADQAGSWCVRGAAYGMVLATAAVVPLVVIGGPLSMTALALASAAGDGCGSGLVWGAAMQSVKWATLQVMTPLGLADPNADPNADPAAGPAGGGSPGPAVVPAGPSAGPEALTPVSSPGG